MSLFIFKDTTSCEDHVKVNPEEKYKRLTGHAKFPKQPNVLYHIS